MEELSTNMRMDAYNQLKYQILHGVYYPGQKISEKIVSQDLGIGRTPVREAIIRLERYSLVEVVPQSGTYVTKIDLKSAETAQFLRRKIDPDVLLQFSINASDDMFKKVEKNLARQKQAAKEGNNNLFFDLDEEFHKLFYIGAGREMIWDWLQMINMHLNRYRWLRLEVAKLNWDTLLDQHNGIYQAVKERNVEGVRFTAESHLRLMLTELPSLLEKFPDYFDQNTELDDQK
ncbi:transcriptional regulator [Paucilactobacillus vaccinostercus DSM 20634]|jgi:DNA-binding GntR family transcriptional regulator|uniref:Transcriptional regulator n=1 Tax=Paucilactobacillus vaccinostercus DSM 20634 TaxID=1423813 RepID=A0A0R2AE19_9LACO|nr:GntR family transcriptional regulator [Paucilactobacillus vaccinostercus]KRM61958.1 transcriptional regulator [Paucilactobacillus vaccinostercus DSM 20634]RRG10738.1 MAG: GntR family transcriptional regulator [Lactobacillus sp.]